MPGRRVSRREISDVATALFLERGFDEVTVAEVARAAGVVEKTVFNHFPTKESLVLDREDRWAAAVRAAVAGPEPVDAAVALIVADLDDLLGGALGPGDAQAVSALIARTPALRAAAAVTAERITDVAAAGLAERTGRDPDDPRILLLATAVVALWRVQLRSLARHVGRADLRERVLGDVRAAATLARKLQ
ncbi:TetR/AcrR family transcriptional regulator [Pseudonocardia ailaonensis]|uniref:TetR/AcrR family transcriptional regulator n=1 Tax=Pseudonocardia ailaonensis TaxID=367279 RepID=A0ABN2NLQ2_9PSEU